jgi:hypothetical protein
MKSKFLILVLIIGIANMSFSQTDSARTNYLNSQFKPTIKAYMAKNIQFCKGTNSKICKMEYTKSRILFLTLFFKALNETYLKRVNRYYKLDIWLKSNLSKITYNVCDKPYTNTHEYSYDDNFLRFTVKEDLGKNIIKFYGYFEPYPTHCCTCANQYLTNSDFSYDWRVFESIDLLIPIYELTPQGVYFNWEIEMQ